MLPTFSKIRWILSWRHLRRRGLEEVPEHPHGRLAPPLLDELEMLEPSPPGTIRANFRGKCSLETQSFFDPIEFTMDSENEEA